MSERNEIRGTVQSAYMALLRARQALLAGLEEEDCMLTPSDMELMRRTIRDSSTVLTDIRKATAKFGEVADVRKNLVITT